MQISASEAFAKKISRFFIVFVTTSVTFLNYTLDSSGKHIQNIQINGGNTVRAHTGDFTMAAAGRAFGPTRAAPGINSPDNDPQRVNQLRVMKRGRKNDRTSFMDCKHISRINILVTMHIVLCEILLLHDVTGS